MKTLQIDTIVDNFIIDHLNRDNPVLMLSVYNPFVDTRWILNEPAQWHLVDAGAEKNFDSHWVTITKYFKDGTTEKGSIAFSSWRKRFSVYTDLLLNHFGVYYLEFYVYELDKK